MGQARTMRASVAWGVPDVASLLARLFRRTSRAHSSAQSQAARSAWAPTATPRRPALTLVSENNPLPAWASSFSAVMPIPLSDTEVSALAATHWPRIRPMGDDAVITAPGDAPESDCAETQAALAEALARLRALTIQSRH